MLTSSQQFHQTWPGLLDPHVRALAWLLSTPDLLRPDSFWIDGLADLNLDISELKPYLYALDAQPQPLHQFLQKSNKLRLGHYAEKLLEFYLRQTQQLFACNVQVREDNGHTLGEFDFILRRPEGLMHLELATKFYLFLPESGVSEKLTLQHFLGPNLADSLGLKVDKIFKQQLRLSEQVSARQNLAEPIVTAAAMIKGWLFYPCEMQNIPELSELAPGHCTGHWCTLGEFAGLALDKVAILPRSEWLAPALHTSAAGFSVVHQVLIQHFLHDQAPVLVAGMTPEHGMMVETARYMVVADDWLMRARARLQDIVRN
jgi:hypothetical protein